ncbi:MAG: 4'-phosphopantetheinyl transferase superfamily protein [Bacteroidota bacterium]
MLGIDIVDLKDPKLKVRGDRAFQLILNQYDELLSHEREYWIVWSAKEAVFKCRREALNFSPTHIPIQLKEMNKVISFTSSELSGKIAMTDSYVLALCSDKMDKIGFQIFESKEISNSNTTRESIITFFKKRQIEVSIGADDLNLPILLPFKEPISLSHHGHWSAFVYPKYILE